MSADSRAPLSPDWARIKSILAEVLEADPTSRESILDHACAGDGALRREVLSLMHVESRGQDFLAAAGPATVDLAKAGTQHFESEDDLLCSDRVPGYTLLRELHRGGQGVVYCAVQHSTRREVALKILLDGPFASAASRHRFEREIEIVAQLRHRGIIPIFDSGLVGGHFFYAMEYIRGVTLTEYCRSRKTPTVERLELHCQVCEAVDHAHQLGVIHRDLKPGNILVDESGDVRVLDFGLAKIAGAAKGGNPGSASISLTGQVVGTPAYMSPEQAAGRPGQSDMKSDVYALGVILFELVTDELPYADTSSVSAVLESIRRGDVRRPRSIRRGIGDELETIILKALAPEKQRRYDTAGALARDVKRFLRGEPIDAKRDSGWYVLRKQLGRYKVQTAIALVLVTVIVASLIVSLTYWRQAIDDRDLAREQRVRADEASRELRRMLGEYYSYHLGRAATALGAGNRDEAKSMLAICLEESRGWEWRRLSWLTDGSSRTLDLDVGLLRSLAVSPDGRRLAAGGDRDIVVHDLHTDDPPTVLQAHRNHVWSVAFSQDGARLASGDRSGKLVIWDLAHFQPIASRQDHDNNIRALSFSPDGALLATASFDGTWKVRTAESGEVLLERRHAEESTPSGSMRWVAAVRFSPDGRRLAVAGFDGRVAVWDVATWTLAGVLSAEHPVWHLTFSRDGARVLTAGRSSELSIWNVETAERVKTLDHGSSGLGPTGFLADESTVYTTGGSGIEITLWNARSGRELVRMVGHASEITGTALLPGDRWLASSSADGTVKFWDLERAVPTTRILTNHRGQRRAIAFSPDSSRVASGSYNGTVDEWETATGRLLKSLRIHDDWVLSVDYSHDGVLLASGSADGVVKIWNAREGRELRKIQAHGHGVNFLKFSRRDGRLATCGDELIKLWEAESGRLLLSIDGSQVHDGLVDGVALHDESSRLTSCDMAEHGRVAVWNALDGSHLVTLRDESGMTFSGSTRSVTFSPDGERIAAASRLERLVRVWDSRTGEALFRLRNDDDEISSVVFSADGARIVSIGKSGRVSIWESASGRLLYGFDSGHPDTVWTVTMSPDGQTLASACDGGEMRLFDTGPPAADDALTRSRIELARRAAERHAPSGRSIEDAIRSIRADLSLDSQVVAVACEFVVDRGPDPNREHERFAWSVVSRPGRDDSSYRAARRRAELAHRLAPDDAVARTTFGVASYRVGEYDEALGMLESAGDPAVFARPDNSPTRLAFLAMTLARLDRPREARDAVRQVQAAVAAGSLHRNTEVIEYLREAEANLESTIDAGTRQ